MYDLLVFILLFSAELGNNIVIASGVLVAVATFLLLEIFYTNKGIL